MAYFLVKTFITAILVAGISELTRRYTLWAALLASLPLTSILAFIWIYWEQKDPQKIIELSYSVFWLVIPSLVFFLVLPLLLKHGFAFTWAMLIAGGATAVCYAGAIYLQKILT
jgi:inner membrane protein involved in colicin E2 resistance